MSSGSNAIGESDTFNSQISPDEAFQEQGP